MQLEPGFPKTMSHPAYKPASIATKPYENNPARFPPVTVFKSDDEQRLRAQGYLVTGETVPPAVEYSEYPLMMVHPQHEPAIPDEQIVEGRKENGEIMFGTKKGRPEKFGPVTVNSEAEEKAWEKKGWGRPAKADPDAFVSARVAPIPDPLHDIKENEYPKWLKEFGRVVNTREEELTLTKGTAQMIKPPAPPPTPIVPRPVPKLSQRPRKNPWDTRRANLAKRKAEESGPEAA